MPVCWKSGKTSVLVVERDEQRLDPLVRPAQAAQQLVGVPGPGALADDLGPAAGLDEDGVALLGQAAEQRGDRHVERDGQALEGREARGGLGVLDLGEHPLGDPGPLGQLADVQADLEAAGPDVIGDDLTELPVALVAGRRYRWPRASGGFGSRPFLRSGRLPALVRRLCRLAARGVRPLTGACWSGFGCGPASGHGRPLYAPVERAARSAARRTVSRQRIWPAPT